MPTRPITSEQNKALLVAESPSGGEGISGGTDKANHGPNQGHSTGGKVQFLSIGAQELQMADLLLDKAALVLSAHGNPPGKGLHGSCKLGSGATFQVDLHTRRPKEPPGLSSCEVEGPISKCVSRTNNAKNGAAEFFRGDGGHANRSQSLFIPVVLAGQEPQDTEHHEREELPGIISSHKGVSSCASCFLLLLSHLYQGIDFRLAEFLCPSGVHQGFSAGRLKGLLWLSQSTRRQSDGNKEKAKKTH
jgi:hypothetical protein